MSIRLKWMNRNPTFDSVTIYRDTKVIDLTALPAPLVVLTNKETEYLDTTAPRGTLVWYAFAIKEGTEVVYSKSKPMVNIDYSGPGPQTIIMGDWNQGYFGSVPSADMFTQAEVCSPFGIPNAAGGLNWHKFAYRGKVLYIPDVVIATAIGWNYLYNKGLVFGVDGDGPTGHGNTPTNQFKTLTRGSDQFLVRLPRTNLNASFAFGTSDPESEWWSCIYAMAGNSRAGTSTLLPITMLNSLNNGGLTVATTQTPVAEFQSGTITSGCQHINTSNYVVNTANPGNVNRNTNTFAWRPVLEYIYP